MNPPDPSTLRNPELLSRFKDMRMQHTHEPMPPIVEFFGEWGTGLEAVAMCFEVNRDDAFDIIYLGTTGFSADRVVLCIDAFITTPDKGRRDGLAIFEADRNPDGGVNLLQVNLPYTVNPDDSFTWEDPITFDGSQGEVMEGPIADCLRDSFARPKTIDADLDGVFLADMAEGVFGVKREESRTYLRAATACVITNLGTCQLMVGATSDEEREKMTAFMERTAGVTGMNVDVN